MRARSASQNEDNGLAEIVLTFSPQACDFFSRSDYSLLTDLKKITSTIERSSFHGRTYWLELVVLLRCFNECNVSFETDDTEHIQVKSLLVVLNFPGYGDRTLPF